MTARTLLAMSLVPVRNRIARWLMERKLRTLYRLCDYFRWQCENGSAGLRDTRKRIVVLESDIRNLRS